MLSIETEARVAKLFLNLADGEKSVEINRQVLAEQLDFDAYQIFKRLDSQGKNNVDEFDLVDFLKLNSIYCSYNEARFIISFYDADGDGGLNYSEFLNLVLSDSNYTLRRIARDRVGLSTRLNLSYDVEYSLSKLLERELDLVRNLDLGLSDLKKRYDFNVYDLYSSFEVYSTLVKENIRKFLMRNGVDVFETDVSAIAKRLDIDRDTRISFTEFNKFFSFPNYSKESIQYKSSNLTGSINRSNLYESKSSVRRYESPMRTTGSSLRSLNESYSPNKTVRFSSPLRESYTNPIVSRSPVLSRSPVITRNTVRSPIRTNLRSPIRSPIRSPLRTTLRSPLRVSDRSPNRSLLKSVDSLNRSVVRNNESFSVSKPSLSTYLSLEEENFQNFLNEIISVENEIERSKCNLALRSDFNVEDAFRIFELDSRGYVSDLDIKFGLNSLDLYPTSEEINLLLKRYDTRNTGAISYTSFFNMVAPLDREYRRMIEGRLPSEYVYRYNKSDVLLPTTKVYLQNLFSLMIKSEAKMEGWRQRLNTMVRFDVRRIFDKFDSIEKGYLSESDIIGYLKLNSINYFIRDVDLLILRLDRDSDGRISYTEFCDELYPRSREYFGI